MTRRVLIVLGLLALVLVGTCGLRWHVRTRSAFEASQGVAIFEAPESDEIRSLRGGRIVSGLIVGASLAIAGVMLQSLLRNPLAAPDLLGVSAGAELAVTLSMVIGAGAGLGLGGALGVRDPVAALVGSFAALGLVYMLSQRRGMVDPINLVLVGVILSIMLGAGTTLVRLQMPDRGLSAAWLFMGMISDETSLAMLMVSGVVLLGAMGIGVWLGPTLDAMAMDEDEARSVGVRVSLMRGVQLGLAGVLSASAVTLAGPIGFVGLVCPHAVRMTAGPAHRWLIVGAAMAGGIMLVGADAAVGLVASIWPGHGRVPIGVLTALIGGPVFIMLLRGQTLGK